VKKLGDLIQDRDYPEDIAIIIQDDELYDDVCVFWLAGHTVGQASREQRDWIEKDFDLLSSAKKEIAKNLVEKEI
jgi:hypothetical protein